MQDMLASGGAGLRILRLRGAIPVEGGLPLISDGKIIGAIGLSGDSSENDGRCAQAGGRHVEVAPRAKLSALIICRPVVSSNFPRSPLCSQ